MILRVERLFDYQTPSDLKEKEEGKRKGKKQMKDKTFMSFIALLDGNEIKWKIEKKIKRSGGRTRDKRNITAKKDGRQQRQLFWS